MLLGKYKQFYSVFFFLYHIRIIYTWGSSRVNTQGIKVASHSGALSFSPTAPCPLASTPSLRLQTQREETAKCVSWKGGEVEKAHPAPRITAAPPEPPPLAFLQRQQKFPERGVSANSNRAHSPLCGPPAAHVGPHWASWGLAAAGALWIKVTAMSQLL